MPLLPVGNPTLLDLARRQNPDGSIAGIVELLNQTNEVLQDMSWVEGNLITGHRTTVRSGIPEPTWRKLYGGVQPTKSTTVQITDNTGMLEAYAEVDKALADLNGNTTAFRLSEDRPHIEGMNQEVARTIFYGNEGANPAAFTGLTPRYNDAVEAENRDNIINGGGVATDKLNSIWLIGWGPETIHGIIPKGSIAGLQIADKGQVTIENVDGKGGRMEAYRTHYRWDTGLTVRDWRYAGRIANLPWQRLKPRPDDSGGDMILPDMMFELLERMPTLTGARFAFYMSRSLITLLRQQSSHLVRNSTLTIEQVGGVPVMSFHGIPVRRVDALAADEAFVTFA